MRLKFKNVGLRFNTHYRQWYVTPALYAVRIPGFKPNFMPGFQIPGFWHIELTWLKWALVFTLDRADDPELPIYEPQTPQSRKYKYDESTNDRLQKLTEKSARLLRYLIFIYAAIAVLQALEVILKLSK